MKKSSKSVIFWAVVLIILVGSVLAVASGSGGDEGNNNAAATSEINESEWTKGTPGSKVEIVEYSDFQCPACRGFERIINPIVSEFSNHVYFAYRHFPLKSIHPNATLSARAAEAAGIQGKFWEMHDKLFEGQSAWEKQPSEEAKKIFITYATELELDLAAFEADIDSGKLIDKVEDAYNHAVEVGVTYTPSIFVNGVLIKNPGSVDEFRTLIRTYLDEK